MPMVDVIAIAPIEPLWLEHFVYQFRFVSQIPELS